MENILEEISLNKVYAVRLYEGPEDKLPLHIKSIRKQFGIDDLIEFDCKIPAGIEAFRNSISNNSGDIKSSLVLFAVENLSNQDLKTIVDQIISLRFDEKLKPLLIMTTTDKEKLPKAVLSRCYIVDIS